MEAEQAPSGRNRTRVTLLSSSSFLSCRLSLASPIGYAPPGSAIILHREFSVLDRLSLSDSDYQLPILKKLSFLPLLNFFLPVAPSRS